MKGRKGKKARRMLKAKAAKSRQKPHKPAKSCKSQNATCRRGTGNAEDAKSQKATKSRINQQNAEKPRSPEAQKPRSQEAEKPRSQEAKKPKSQEAKKPKAGNKKTPYKLALLRLARCQLVRQITMYRFELKPSMLATVLPTSKRNRPPFHTSVRMDFSTGIAIGILFALTEGLQES